MAKPYHHGNLRETLINAASDLIAQKGGYGFTLAEAAKVAGVSVAAPYRHFPSKDDLIIALAEQGFTTFATSLRTARKSQPDPMLSILAMGKAYLTFSIDHKGAYIAMFESGVSLDGNQKNISPAVQSFAELLVASEIFVRSISSANKPMAGEVAQHIWALSHGVTSLFLRNSPDPDAPQRAQYILENGARTYLKGLCS